MENRYSHFSQLLPSATLRNMPPGSSSGLCPATRHRDLPCGASSPGYSRYSLKSMFEAQNGRRALARSSAVVSCGATACAVARAAATCIGFSRRCKARPWTGMFFEVAANQAPQNFRLPP